MKGCPPTGDELVTLSNWQTAPYNRWAFSHLHELVPTQRVRRGRAVSPALPVDYQQLSHLIVHRADGHESSVEAVIQDTYTDAVIVLHHGHIVMESYFGETEFDTTHLLMSVTKSIVGSVAGNLVEQGLLSPDQLVTDYVPELLESGYVNARVRNVLDMRSGIQFSEEYTDPEAEVRVMEQAFGWSPTTDGGVAGSIYDYLCTLKAKSEHGGAFEYRSCETLVLGWVCERAAGIRMADLISSLIWGPMGADWDAELTCDAVGTGIHDGGLCATARDLARFGQVLLNDGQAIDGTQVIPKQWLAASWAVDPDIRSAFDQSGNGEYLPAGWYRNQFWFLPRIHGDVLLCLGINGQMVYVNPGTQTVAVKLSTWPDAQSGHLLHDTLRMFDVIGAELSGLAPERARHDGPLGVAAGISR